MGYAILPALIPEIEEIYNVYFAAFKGDPMGEIMVNTLFPGGTESPEFRKAHAAGTLAWWNQSRVQYTYKCVDTETNEIIGMGLGDILIKGRTEEERQFGGVPWLEGEQKEKAEAVLKPLHETREKLFAGRPHLCKTSFTCLVENPFTEADMGLRHTCHRRPPQAPGPQGRCPLVQMGHRDEQQHRPAALLRGLPFHV